MRRTRIATPMTSRTGDIVTRSTAIRRVRPGPLGSTKAHHGVITSGSRI